MTLVVILFSAVLAGFWLPANGPYIIGTLNVFDTIFAAGLIAATLAALYSRQTAPLLAAAVLIGNFIGSRFIWVQSDPVIIGAVLDLLTASYFVLLGRARWEFLIGALYLLSVLAAALTGWLDVIPDHTERPAGLLIAWSYPDIAANIGLACSVLLGAGSGDWGKLLTGSPIGCGFRFLGHGRGR